MKNVRNMDKTLLIGCKERGAFHDCSQHPQKTTGRRPNQTPNLPDPADEAAGCKTIVEIMTEAIYVRQSKDKKDSLSIDGQIERCKRECIHPETALIYEDRGFSGKNTFRPGFRRMQQDVKEGKISKIIVYRLDRLSRSILDFGQFWDELDRYQVDFVSVNEKFDTTTPMGRAMIYIIMVFAQLERETIAERVTDNYYTRIKRGCWPGGTAPFGMKNRKIKDGEGRDVPSLDYTQEFAIVQEIFHRYAKEEVSLGEIAKDLTRRRIPCRRRKAGWDNVTLARILHSPVYVQADEEVYRYYASRGIGKISNPPEDFTGNCSAQVVGKRAGNVRKYTSLQDQVLFLTNFEGRIPSDVWLACQYKLDTNRQIGNSGKGKNTWLSGLLKCGNCGYSLTVRAWKGKKHLYCSGRTNLHLCDRKSFSQNVEVVEAEVQKELEQILEECNREYIPVESGEENRKLKKELIDIDNRIQRLVVRMQEASEISMKYINGELETLDHRREELTGKYDEEAKKSKDNCRSFYKEIHFDKLNFEEKKMTAQAFIERINVFEDAVEIIWKV